MAETTQTPEKRHLDKTLKNADQFQRGMIEGFQWTTAHSKMILGVIAVLVIAAAGWSFAQYQSAKTETAVQEKYFLLEKQVLEKKDGFERATQAKNPKADAKAPAPVAATGDLQKDYGDLPNQFEALVKEYPKTHGAQMAALNASDIYMTYKKPEEALRILQSVASTMPKSEMLSALVWNQLGSVYADQGKCQDAIQQWQKIVDNRSLKFAQDEAKLRMGVCYETLNDLAKAEQMYSEVAKREEAGGMNGASQDAEKYLRLLKMKKNISGSGT